MTRLPYNRPEVEDLGRVSRLTMGNNGSSLDGNCTMTQHGIGNDDQDDGGPNSCSNKGGGKGGGKKNSFFFG